MDETPAFDLTAATADALVLPNSVDTHFHSIEMRRAGLDPSSILAWCFSRGLRGALDVSVAAEDVAERLLLAESHPGLAVAAGYYPSEAARFVSDPEHARSMMKTLESAIEDPRVVAVGEIGLDWHREYAPKPDQEKLFVAQVEVAAARGLPIVVHNREADAELVAILKGRQLGRGGIMHCFSSDAKTAFRLIDLGFAISFAGNVTYRNSHVIQESARRVPLHALLVETDAPYLAPVPLRGRKNNPGYVGHTYHFLAQLRGEPVETLVEQVAENFRRITAPI